MDFETITDYQLPLSWPDEIDVKKTKRPSFLPKQDTRVVSLKTTGLIGHQASLQLVKDIVAGNVIYLKKDNVIAKASPSRYDFFTPSHTTLVYTVNEALVGDELKLKQSSSGVAGSTFEGLVIAQIDKLTDDEAFEISIHTCVYDTEVEKRRSELRKEFKINKKKERRLATGAVKKRKCDAVGEASTDKTHEIEEERRYTVASPPVESLDSSCWFYVSAGRVGSENPTILSLNAVRPSMNLIDATLHHDDEMDHFSLKNALSTLKMKTNGTVVAKEIKDGFHELSMATHKRHKSYWLKHHEFLDLEDNCTFKVVFTPNTEAKDPVSPGSSVHITDDSLAPACFKVVIGVKKRSIKRKAADVEQSKKEFSVESETMAIVTTVMDEKPTNLKRKGDDVNVERLSDSEDGGTASEDRKEEFSELIKANQLKKKRTSNQAGLSLRYKRIKKPKQSTIESESE